MEVFRYAATRARAGLIHGDMGSNLMQTFVIVDVINKIISRNILIGQTS